MIGFEPFLSTKAFNLAANGTTDQVVTFSAQTDIQIRALSIYLSTGASHGRNFNLRPVGEPAWIADSNIDIASVIGSTFLFRLHNYLTIVPSAGIEVDLVDTLNTACTVYILFAGLQVIDTEAS